MIFFMKKEKTFYFFNLQIILKKLKLLSGKKFKKTNNPNGENNFAFSITSEFVKRVCLGQAATQPSHGHLMKRNRKIIK